MGSLHKMCKLPILICFKNYKNIKNYSEISYGFKGSYSINLISSV